MGIAAGDQLLQRVAGRLGLGTEAAEHAVECEDPSRDRFKASFLGGVETVGRGDEQAEHEGRHRSDKPRQAINQVAGFVHLLILGGPGLVNQPRNSAEENENGDDDRK
jgi:hypothetical protein